MLKAVGNSVLIKIAKPVEVSGAGILLPFAEREWNEGEVVSVGEKCKLIAPFQPHPPNPLPESKDRGEGESLKPLRVTVRGEQGLEFEYEGDTYLLVSEHEVLSIINE